MLEREREKRKPSFSLRFTGFRRLEFDSPRVKATLRNESYVWVPESQDFADSCHGRVIRNQQYLYP